MNTKNIKQILVFFNTGIGGIALENISEINPDDVVIRIEQFDGAKHHFLYEELDKITIKFGGD